MTNEDEHDDRRFTEVDPDVRKRTTRFGIGLFLMIIIFISISILSRNLGW